VPKEQITQISMVLSPTFIAGAAKSFPAAVITFDRFHVVKLLNEAMDKVRRVKRIEHKVVDTNNSDLNASHAMFNHPLRLHLIRILKLISQQPAHGKRLDTLVSKPINDSQQNIGEIHPVFCGKQMLVGIEHFLDAGIAEYGLPQP
jgi:hypothetical protein